MRGHRFGQAALIGSAACAVVISALTATNAVPATRLALRASAVAVDQLKPKPQCNGITVTVLRAGMNGGNGNDLVLGRPRRDRLRGNGGNDCIHGGGDSDQLHGGPGTDVCIGGPGVDTFDATCETQIL